MTMQFSIFITESSYRMRNNCAKSLARVNIHANFLCASLVWPTGSQRFCPGYHCQWDHLLLLSNHPGLFGLPPGILYLQVFFSTFLYTNNNCPNTPLNNDNIIRIRSRNAGLMGNSYHSVVVKIHKSDIEIPSVVWVSKTHTTSTSGARFTACIY